MKLICTNPATERLYDEETMGDVYDPGGGVRFRGSPENRTGRIKQECDVERLVEKYDSLELPADGGDDSESES